MEKDSSSQSFRIKLRFIKQQFNLKPELDDFERIHESFLKESVFKGTNLWILIFAIIIASVGLNMNSTAVIIGAMLISPLMGPINGIGYSLATYDFELLRKALKNFTFAVVTSIIASASYFFLTPISTAQSELLARTSPTIYDVLIALFGGLAGIVAISSKQKGNVIPGVAIATALMPPLCTAGYGLATFQPNFFFGASYLFTINTVFIALSSMVVSQFLNFPIRSLVDPKRKARVNQTIWLVIWITLLPSIYFGYGLVKKEQFNQKASRLVEEISLLGSNFLLQSKIKPEQRIIELAYGGSGLSGAEISSIYMIAHTLSIDSSSIKIIQGMSYDTYFKQHFKESQNIAQEASSIKTQNMLMQEKIDSLIRVIEMRDDLRLEINTLFPEIIGFGYANLSAVNPNDSVKGRQNAAFVQLKKGIKLKLEDRNRIERWIKMKIEDDKALIFYAE